MQEVIKCRVVIRLDFVPFKIDHLCIHWDSEPFEGSCIGRGRGRLLCGNRKDKEEKNSQYKNYSEKCVAFHIDDCRTKRQMLLSQILLFPDHSSIVKETVQEGGEKGFVDVHFSIMI